MAKNNYRTDNKLVSKIDTNPPKAPEPVEVAYTKTGSDGKPVEKQHKKTSGAMIDVFSKWPHDMRYDTPFGECIIKGLSSLKILGSPYAQSQIPVECWNYLAQIYGSTPMYKNHFIYAAKNKEYGEAHAKELADEKTGMERIEPGKMTVGVDTYKE